MQHIADSCRFRHSSASLAFKSSLGEIREAAGHLGALLVHPFRRWVENGILVSTDRLRRRLLPHPGIAAPLESSSPQAALMKMFRGEVDLHGCAAEVLRHRARRWATADEVEPISASFMAILRRNDVPEAVRYNVFRTSCNGWITSRRLAQTASPCKFGCGALDGDSVEHYLFCSRVAAMAKFHLGLDVFAARGRVVRNMLGFAGLPGDRGFRVALHMDATLMVHNRIRHEDAGGPSALFAARLKEASWRHPAVAAIVRHSAVERRRAA